VILSGSGNAAARTAPVGLFPRHTLDPLRAKVDYFPPNLLPRRVAASAAAIGGLDGAPNRRSRKMAQCSSSASSWWCPTRSFASIFIEISACDRAASLDADDALLHLLASALHICQNCVNPLAGDYAYCLLCQFTRIDQASRVLSVDSILRCADSHFLSGAPGRGPSSAQSDSTDS
jgi:hypothetical protein